MNTFRSALDDRLKKATGPVMPAKKPRGASEDLDSIKVGRSERRTANHREDDRHRLASETARLKTGRKTVDVELINLSGGGAMVRTDAPLQMWEKVSLILGDCDGLDCAVLWIKGDRVGLEFAPETQIGASRPKRTMPPPLARHRPLGVPIQSAPARSSSRETTMPLGSPERKGRAVARAPST